MKRTKFAVCLATAFFAVAPSLRAQQQVTIPTPVVPAFGPTLAQALTQAQPPQTLCLTVGGDKLQASDPPAPGASVPAIADAYNRLTFTYPTVNALAPPQMTLVYSPPDTPNPLDGMPPAQVMQLLTKTFSAAQWKQFMGSSDGIGYADMQTLTQRQLFGALFPDGHLVIVKNLLGDPNAAATKQDISGNVFTQAHLRLGFLTSLALQMADKPDNHIFAETVEPAGAPTRYFMINNTAHDADKEYGATVRETGPTSLKQSDLTWDNPVLAKPVPLAEIKTVDDLVAQVAAATHLEIYADSRYGSRTVTIVGPATGVTAGDLLRALAVCVTGTYRKVGPAYVLTDDLTGIGTKHVQWRLFEAKAQAMLPGSGPNGSVMFPQPSPQNPYTVQDISWGNDPLGMTAAEQKQFWDNWHHSAANQFSPIDDQLDLTIPFNQLSPVQQDVAQQIQQQDQAHKINTTLDGTVMVQAEAELEITLPNLDGPVIVFQSYQDLLPTPLLTPAEQKAQQQQMIVNVPSDPTNAYPGPLRPLLRQFTRSAVIIAPKTTEEAVTEMAALAKLGFTEAWVQASPTTENLAAAVKAGRSAGVAVFADVHLLAPPADAPDENADLDILGLTPMEASKDPQLNVFNPRVTVTPFTPDVAAHFATQMATWGKVPGLAGIVWPDPPPPGYSRYVPDSVDIDRDNDSLGYADAGRLAFLRWKHTDPVDVYTNSVTDERAHVVVPSFNDNFHQEASLYDAWRGLRAHVYLTLLQRLAAALPPAFHPGSTSRLPLLVAPGNTSFADLLGSWDNWTQPPPDETFDTPLGPDGQPLTGVPVTMHLPSALVYSTVFAYTAPNAPASAWASAAAAALSLAQRKGDHNVVIDASARPALLEALLDRDRQMTPDTIIPASR